MSEPANRSQNFCLPAIDPTLRLQISGQPVAFESGLDSSGKTLILRGNWHPAPVQAQTKEPVLLVHSFGGNKQEYNGFFSRLAFELTCSGFDVLRFDCRGCGESDGLTDDIHPRALVQDTRAALGWLTGHTGKKRVHLAGYSLGGLIAALSLPQTVHHLASLTLIQSPYDLARELKRRYPMGFDGLRTSAYINAPLFKMGADFKAQLPEAKPPTEGKEYAQINQSLDADNRQLPVLLITGSNDIIVPQSTNLQNWQTYFESSRYLLTSFCVAQADHGFSSQGDLEECIGRLCEFLSSVSAS
ncbi:MAG: alpha/beta fold hydrolase [Candidatus Obscuribacter sp.]|jgi:alpha-beta hydrolase superfamily lysophospholipase|nr:alpha/beta fold hydrolase [Candidatus Obscuribacter sp.]MBK9773835.1 alpha/beta fold hydrolase [Candidatus Obscuribacter sp.]